MFRNEDNERLAKKRRTSVCKPGYENMGNNPRKNGAHRSGCDGIATKMPSRRSIRRLVLVTLSLHGKIYGYLLSSFGTTYIHMLCW